MLKLEFEGIAGGRAYHAAMVKMERPGNRYAMHTHDFHEMMYVERGGVHLVGDETRELRAGELIFVRAFDAHQILGNTTDCCFINVAFPLRSWEPFCALAGLDPERPGRRLPGGPAPTVLLRGDDLTRCRRTFAAALDDFEDNATPLRLCAFLAAVAPLLEWPEVDAKSGPVPSDPGWLRDACLKVCGGDQARISVSEFAAMAGVTREHLARSLRAAVGMSPTEYLTNLQLDRATRLLRGADMTILDVALECGFDSLSYFYRTFRRRYGVTPLQYRQRRQREIMP